MQEQEQQRLEERNSSILKSALRRQTVKSENGAKDDAPAESVSHENAQQSEERKKTVSFNQDVQVFPVMSYKEYNRFETCNDGCSGKVKCLIF